MVFNPAAVEFTPGKDSAQLATVLAILCGWMLAYLRGRRFWGAVAGMAAALGLMIGLIHVWVAAIIASATLWHSLADGSIRRWIQCCALPAAAAFSAMAGVIWLALDWNLALSTWRVAQRYGEIQLPVITEPFYWTLVGLPMFLLFVGPLPWVQAVAMPADLRDSVGNLGRAVLVCTLAVMAYTYFFANNSETPRLWIPFIPPLLWGLAARRSSFRGDDRPARALHVLLIALQVGVTAVHWSLMDVRESEWRLITKRMWN
jgi:hypothetical protein